MSKKKIFSYSLKVPLNMFMRVLEFMGWNPRNSVIGIWPEYLWSTTYNIKSTQGPDPLSKI